MTLDRSVYSHPSELVDSVCNGIELKDAPGYLVDLIGILEEEYRTGLSHFFFFPI